MRDGASLAYAIQDKRICGNTAYYLIGRGRVRIMSQPVGDVGVGSLNLSATVESCSSVIRAPCSAERKRYPGTELHPIYM